MSKINSHKKFLVMFIIAVVLASCSAVSGRQSAGEYLDDSVITTKVKGAVFKESSLKTLDIGVETFQGVVQLSGFVDTPQESAKAEDLASRVRGVKSVKNNLVVRQVAKK